MEGTDENHVTLVLSKIKNKDDIRAVKVVCMDMHIDGNRAEKNKKPRTEYLIATNW